MDWIALLSLLFLLCAIAIGFITKINTGLLAIAFALILSRIAGIPDSEIIKGFNYSLFFTLTGVTYLFSIAKVNGTLELFAKKAVFLCGDHTYLIPGILFFLAVILSGVGPGTISVAALMAAITVPLAIQMKISPVKLAPFGLLGACAGGFSHIAPTGIIAITFAEQNDITGLKYSLLVGLCLGMGLYAAILYISFKWFSFNKAIPLTKEDLPAFNKKQLITLSGIGLMSLLTLFLQVNIGLAAFFVALFLMLFRVADEKKAIAGIPLGTLWLVTGVGVLMNLIMVVGGIDLLSEFLAGMMTKNTAVPLFTLTGGILSWFSSASGVVLPTLIPTIPIISESVNGLNGAEMVIGLGNGAHAASLSPLSTLGALVLASYSAVKDPDSQERNRLFLQMFLISIIGVILVSVIAFTGVFGLIAYRIPTS